MGVGHCGWLWVGWVCLLVDLESGWEFVDVFVYVDEAGKGCVEVPDGVLFVVGEEVGH